MSKALVTVGPTLIGSRVIRQLLSAGHEMRTMVGGAMHRAEVRTTQGVGDAQPGEGAPFIAADRDHDAERLDAVAGSEFVDDRIRLLE